jgi:hypothetical protein
MYTNYQSERNEAKCSTEDVDRIYLCEVGERCWVLVDTYSNELKSVVNCGEFSD